MKLCLGAVYCLVNKHHHSLDATPDSVPRSEPACPLGTDAEAPEDASSSTVWQAELCTRRDTMGGDLTNYIDQ